MHQNSLTLGRYQRPPAALFVVTATLSVGYLDYATGPHVSMSTFYLLPLAIAAWSWGFSFAFCIAITSALISVIGNTINGDFDYLTPNLALWNGGSQLASFIVVALTVAKLGEQQRHLERRVRDRTLTAERLQRDLLQVSEREQRRIGQDLHDGLCQHLAGAAFKCQTLQDELADQSLPQAKNVEDLVDLLKEAVLLARQSAMGLDPVEMAPSGLMESLSELASTTEALFQVSCCFECSFPVLIQDSVVAAQLFRIAQEAVRNAIKHGRPAVIRITLEVSDAGTELRVEDDGVGIENTLRTNKGMGLSIMQNRAEIIGGSFEARNKDGGGTIVRCLIPEPINSRTAEVD